MNKRDKLKYCNYSLLISILPMLVTSILLVYMNVKDLYGTSFLLAAGCHAVFALIMLGLVIYHLYLHFGNNKWRLKISKLKSHVTKILIVIALFTFISGISTAIQWCVLPSHSALGAIHGRIGIFFLLFAIGHTLKRKKWFKSKPRTSA